MKKLLISVFISMLIYPSWGFSQTYELVWFENFDGDELDLSSWTYETGGNWYNNELQHYTDREKNIRVENSKLIIEAHKENYGGNNYTSARIKTQGKKFFKYGRIEARIKMPFGQGMWPGFWMMGINEPVVGWPACGEIDVVEMIGGSNRERTIYGTAHWSHNGSHAEYGGMNSLASGLYSDDFHIYSIEWDEQFIKWFVDGNQYHEIDITPAQLSEFHQEFFFLLNVAVGGDWPGNPNAATEFPQKMEVDFIRVVQFMPTPVTDEEQSDYTASFEVYPNPFNSMVSMLVSINSGNNVNSRIDIINALGQVVHAERRILNYGVNKIFWSPAADLNSGVYFIRLRADEFYQTRKIVYLK
jgi:beta-glucanase (GH16 family)